MQYSYSEFSKCIFEYEILIDSTEFHEQKSRKKSISDKLIKYYTLFPVPREKNRLISHQDPESENFIRNGLSTKVKKLHAKVNNPRLLFTRLWRFIFNLINTLKKKLNFFYVIYTKYIKPLNTILSLIFTHLAWIFFLPRLITNLLLILKHSIPCSLWMETNEANNLHFNDRIITAFSRRWFEICNDLIWCCNGIISAFFLVGKLSIYSSYITAALFLYDIILLAIKYRIESIKIAYFINKYQYEDLYKITNYLYKLNIIESERFFINLYSNLLFTFGFILTMPISNYIEITSLIGSFLMLVATIFSITEINRNNRKLSDIGKNSGDIKASVLCSPPPKRII